MLAGTEVDAVEDEIQIVAVRLDLRMVDLGQGVLDRQLVEVEDVVEDSGLFRRRFVRSTQTQSRRCPARARPDPPGRGTRVDPVLVYCRP